MCLAKVAGILVGIVFSQNDGKDMVVEVLEDVCQEQFATKNKHASYGREVDVECRAPRREVKVAKVDGGNIDNALCGDAPIGKAEVGHRNTHTSRYQ